MIMNNTLLSLYERLKSLPLWLRAVALVLVASLVLVFTFTSCGPTVRVSARSTTDMVSISVSQSITDSTGVAVSVNPTINFK